jgi:hypothetical protein
LLRDPRVDLAADGDAFLNDPAAGLASRACGGDRFSDCSVPGVLVGFPS